MLVLFQILFILFALFALVSVLKRKKEGQISIIGTIFWIFFWLFAIVAVLWPNSTNILANSLGIGRGSDFIIYVSVVLIFYLIFRLHIKIEAISRDITKVVRKETLKEVEDDNKNNFNYPN